MEQAPPENSSQSQSYTVVSDMNEHGGMTVVDPSTNSTYQIVEYDDGGLRRKLASRDIGETVTVDLNRAGVRANVWRASRPKSVVCAT